MVFHSQVSFFFVPDAPLYQLSTALMCIRPDQLCFLNKVRCVSAAD